jgi:hypothetical protein
MGRRDDRVRWIESTAGEGAAARRPGSLRVSRLLAAADETARRHPAAVAAALFCGGLATGTWLGLVRTRGRGEELAPWGGADRSPVAPKARRDPHAVHDPAPARLPAAPSVARLRNPIGSPSVLQP